MKCDWKYGTSMQFYSLAFVIFITVAIAAYYAIGRFVGKGQWIVLLCASIAFYAFSGWQNLIFIGTTALTIWLSGLAFAHFEALSKEARKAAGSREEKKAIKEHYRFYKRLVLVAALIINFGILGYIKYAEVLVGYIVPNSHWTSGILLPLGISFYTFQTVSYAIDTYNAKYDPERNFAKYLLFASWFPQLIQGPINRFDLLAQQLFEPHSFSAHEARGAFLQICYGALKKFAVANLLLLTIDPIIAHIDPSIPGSVVVIGILFYAIYQYADFSGGIDMALGFSRLFGIHMSPNFRQPYFSISLGDFWRRWHITLGAWMRDYVFYPFALLPGIKRWSKWLSAHCGRHLGRTLPAGIANILVFFLVGLWHGAESHFILWGLYNGIVIAASDLLTPLWDRMNKALHIDVGGKGHHVFAIIRTFIVVNIGWYFDLIEGVGNLNIAFSNTLFNFRPDLALAAIKSYVPHNAIIGLALASIVCIVIFVVSVLKENDRDVSERVLAAPAVVRGLIYGMMIVAIATSFVFAPAGGFMYANF